MIPLRDVNPSSGTAVVNNSIIAACVLIFLYELSLGRHLNVFLLEYGLVPVRFTRPEIARHFTLIEQAIPFVSSMFLHAGWWHLIGNMWVLYIFGDNVENYLGHARYLAFYLAAGISAALVHVVFSHSSRLPTVGASGAIAGIMGAYLILYPRARILTLVPIFFFIQLIEIPAFVFLLLWFLLQFYGGAGSLFQRGDAGGIAWWAHLGGFLSGIFLLGLFGRGSGTNRRWRPHNLSRNDNHQG